MQIRLPGGDLEYAVLSELWELGSATARDIHIQVGEPAGLTFSRIERVRGS
jgi:predicted transcriptional regulator